jgi:DHA1 family tetracycline resistance protein-like MFS transporter
MLQSLRTRAQQKPSLIIGLLAASLALMMTGYGIILPVFARRLEELGAGVTALGFMTMGFAAAQFLLAPFMGSLADRWGRRPLILLSLAGFAVANVLFLLASSTAGLVGVRVFEGAVTAGLLPAAMGVVADTVAEDQRARWTGILMGSYSAGFIFGPALGGVLYDQWGFGAPFIISAALAALGLLFAFLLVPETLPLAQREQRRNPGDQPATSWRASLPRPLVLFGALLLLDFIGVFTFAFVEPEMVFFFYDDLNFSTTQFGILVGAYGLAMVLGQLLLGQASDRIGRRPVIVVGFALNIVFYVALATITQYAWLLTVAVVAGLGSALLTPAMSAYYLDITAEAHRARVMGIKESAVALGGVAGPALVALLTVVTAPQQIFLLAAGLTVFATVLAFVVLAPRRSVSAGQAALAAASVVREPTP